MTIVRQIADTTEEQIKNAQGMIRRSWLASLGAVGMAADTTEKTFNKLVVRGEKATKDARKELKKINTRLRREQQNLTQDVEDAGETVERKLTDVLSSLNVPSRRDLRVLDARVAQLNAQLRELNGADAATPIHNYDTLNVEEINAVLPGLKLDDLYTVEEYEATHNKRVTVLREVERQIADRLSENGEITEPFLGYQALRAEEVVAKLETLSLPELRHVKLYESTHAKRVTVQREVERQIETRLTA
jgi:poly(hydroxyalkanoate) granule-associated protein